MPSQRSPSYTFPLTTIFFWPDTCFFICLQILTEVCAGGAADAVMLGKCLFVVIVKILIL